MALRVCEYCGKAWIGGDEDMAVPLCPGCEEELEGIYKLAWNYLRDAATESGRHRKVSAQELASALEVDVKAIETLVKLGKIQTEASLGERTPEEKKRNLDKLSRIRKGIKKGLK